MAKAADQTLMERSSIFSGEMALGKGGGSGETGEK